MSRERVYALLRQKPEEFVSGQELSQQLGISRAAVWKAIEGLRRDGYTIEGRTGLGYRLAFTPDVLVEREIRWHLGRDCPDLRCLKEVDSTNSYLKREALLGASHRTVATANCQTAGRGRMTRKFVSPPDRGVYLSVLFRPEVPPEALLGASGMAAAAVCNAVERTAGIRPGIKWPNDLVLHGKKLCGILTELSIEGETGMVETLVIGAGVNVSHSREDFGPEVAEIATSLAMEGYTVSRPALAAGCETALGLGWKAGIAAEVLCQPNWAIGSGLQISKTYLDAPGLFAWTGTVIFLSVVTEWLFCCLLRRWREGEE